MGIGENIVFLNKGYKEWVGTKEEIFTAKNEALDDFVFASNLFKMVKKYVVKDLTNIFSCILCFNYVVRSPFLI